MKPTKGFTLIELLVVISIIALLLSIILPSLGRAKLLAQRVVCSSNLRQQGVGTILYADENDSYVPSTLAYTYNPSTGAVTSVYGAWFWDVSFWCTNELSRYAGFDDNKVFTCPANKMRKSDDALWWQFYMVPFGYTMGPSPQPLQDESVLTADQQRQSFRVMPFVYFFDKYVQRYDGGKSLYDPTSASSNPTKYTTRGKPMNELVIRKYTSISGAASRPMIMDAVISDIAQPWKFSDIDAGWLDDNSQGTVFDTTNHLARRVVRIGAGEGPKPDGANIAYADGHADWKSAGDYDSATGNFQNMSLNYVYGEQFWW